MRVLKFIFNHLIIFAIAMLAIFVVTSQVIQNFGYHFVNKVYYLMIAVIVMFLFIGLIQMTIKFKSKIIKCIIIILLVGACALLVKFKDVIVITYKATVPLEYVAEKNGEKYVAYVDRLLTTSVRYYEYVNKFVRKENLSMRDYYGYGYFDPFKEEKPLLGTKYYDKNGNEISKEDFENDGNILTALTELLSESNLTDMLGLLLNPDSLEVENSDLTSIASQFLNDEFLGDMSLEDISNIAASFGIEGLDQIILDEAGIPLDPETLNALNNLDLEQLENLDAETLNNLNLNTIPTNVVESFVNNGTTNGKLNVNSNTISETDINEIMKYIPEDIETKEYTEEELNQILDQLLKKSNY